MLCARPARQHLEAIMNEHGDDVGHGSGRFSAWNFREETTEDRATYRKWMFGVVVFYSTLVLISGGLALLSGTGANMTNLTSISGHSAVASIKPN
jgi:hypothetical protein